MSVSPSRIEPLTTAPLVRSCNRLIARNRVVFPDPDGPMSDVTLFLGTSKATSRIAVRPWKDTDTSSNRIEIGPNRGSPSWSDISVDTLIIVLGSITASLFVAKPQRGGFLG